MSEFENKIVLLFLIVINQILTPRRIRDEPMEPSHALAGIAVAENGRPHSLLIITMGSTPFPTVWQPVPSPSPLEVEPIWSEGSERLDQSLSLQL